MKVRTSEVPLHHLGFITVNKQYEVNGLLPDTGKGQAGNITDDMGISRFILIEHCAHLDGRAWEVVPE